MRCESTATYAVPALKCDGSIFEIMPHAGIPVMFFDTSFHFSPPSLVYQILPSLVPAQISPFSTSDGAIAKITSRRELPEVVADDAAGRHDVRGILRREIRADHLPALAAVGGLEDDVAAVVDVVVIERIDRQRRRPVAAVLESCGGASSVIIHGAHRPRDLRPVVVARHLVAVARGPDDVRICGIGGVNPDSQPPRPWSQVAGAVVAGAGVLRRRSPRRASCRRPACCSRRSTAPGCRR